MDTKKILLGSFIGFIIFLLFVAILTMSFLARQKQIVINYAIDPSVAKLYGDYKKDQIIVKLKETPKEPLTLETLKQEATAEANTVHNVMEMIGMGEKSAVPDSLVQLNEQFPLADVRPVFELKNTDPNVKGVSSDNQNEPKENPLHNVYTISFNADVPVIQLTQELTKRDDIEYAEPNYIVKIDAIPNDPSFPVQWGLNNTGNLGGKADADIDAPEGWDKTKNDTTTTIVAVLDTGVDTGHEDLTNRIWKNTKETVFNGIDDDNNGYIDDVHGWNFLDNNYNISDNNGHGTHVSGIIGAERGNGKGVAGVADKVKIMPIRFLNSNGEGTLQDASQGIIYAANNGAQVINCSFGASTAVPPQTLYEAINYARSKGVLVVTATGNNGVDITNENTYPVNYDLDNIIAVASTTVTDKLSSFSNYSSKYADLAAPGSEIYSTLPDSKYGLKSGTSMATPFVSGAAAVAFSHFPGASYLQIRQYLLGSVDVIPDLQGLLVTGGRLNLNNLVSMNPTAIPTITISPTISPTFVPSITITQPTGPCPKKYLGDADCKADAHGKYVNILDYAIWYSEAMSNCSEADLSRCGNNADGQGDAMDANFNYPGTNYILTDTKVDAFDYAVWIQGFLVE